jgi:hypothetical protein
MQCAMSRAINTEARYRNEIHLAHGMPSANTRTSGCPIRHSSRGKAHRATYTFTPRLTLQTYGQLFSGERCLSAEVFVLVGVMAVEAKLPHAGRRRIGVLAAFGGRPASRPDRHRSLRHHDSATFALKAIVRREICESRRR